MATEVTMPKLGLTMTDAVLLRWLVSEGAHVEKGTPLFELETDKAVVQAESPAAGVLRILAEAGTKVPVAGVVAFVLSAGEALPEVAGPSAPRAAQAGQPRPASPAAKRRARELGIDLAELRGSGEGGRITEKDVDDYVTNKRVAGSEASATPVAQPAAQRTGIRLDAAAARSDGSVVPIAGVRALIAQRMAQSARTVARVTLTTEIDATALVELRAQLNQKLEPLLGFAVTYNDWLVRAAALSLGAFPYMNATLVGEEIHLLQTVNVGIAVDTERGLLVPVVRNADRKGIQEIAREAHGLIERAVAGKSSPDELSGGTFTLSNLGMYGVDSFTPIINPPELAILGVGRIARKPAEHDGQIALRWRLALCLSFDHRLVDGAPAARFLQRVAELVESPFLMLS